MIKIILLALIFVFSVLEYSTAERSGTISSKKNNKSYSHKRGSDLHRTKNYHRKSYNHNKPQRKLTYDKGQQWYLDLYYNRNAYPFYNNNHYKYKSDHRYNKRNRYYKYQYLGYPLYSYPYYYDYGYDRDYYDWRYSNQYGKENHPEQMIDMEYERQNQYDSLQYGDTDKKIIDYEVIEDYSPQNNSEDDIETTIYKWTDDEGFEHYTNNIEKVPEEFRHTIVETQTW